MALCKRQAGFSLVSMLIGMVLCMVTTVGVLAAYKGIVNNAQSSLLVSKSSNLNATVALVASRLLQQAGWGMGVASTPPGGRTNTDIVLLSAAALANGTLTGSTQSIGATSVSGNAVVWDSAISGTVQCSALIQSAGALSRLGPVSCASAAQWGSLNWGSAQSIAPSGSYATAALQAQTTTCWPYGGGPGVQPAVLVTLSNSGTVASSVCLTNIPA
jgi:type II secretory pathway component PulJ